MSASRKRLCVITPTHWTAFMGGAQYQVKCILDELLPSGRFDVTYLTNRVDPDYMPNDHHVVSLDRKIPRFGYLMHAAPLYLALLKIRPDVIYQRVGCGYTGISAFYARRHGIRLIWHVSSDSDVTRNSSIYGRNPVRRLLEKKSIEYGIRHAQNIITQTNQQAHLLRTHYHRNTDVVVPNFHPAPLERINKSRPPMVLWVANLKRLKKPEVFIRMAAALSDLEGVRFIMIGDLMPEGRDHTWSDDLKQKIRATRNLEYMGRQSQDTVNRILAQSHVFVNTSLHEGFPNTFIQAWMRQVPVVTLHANPDSIFEHEKVGIHAQTEEGLYKAVRQFLTDENLQRKYGKAAAAYAKKYHSVRNARLLVELIDIGMIDSGPNVHVGIEETKKDIPCTDR